MTRRIEAKGQAYVALVALALAQDAGQEHHCAGVQRDPRDSPGGRAGVVFSQAVKKITAGVSP
jgi:hypothetical protein